MTLGSFTTAYTLPAFSPTGQYRLTQVYCYDVSDKFSSVTENEFSARWGAALPMGFVQVGTADLTPPEIVNVVISPRVFNTTLSSVRLSCPWCCEVEELNSHNRAHAL
jgi:hypothetical protein